MRNPMHAGLAGDDLARARASDANAAAIAERRRMMATALLAPETPRRALQARWSALLYPDRAIPITHWGATSDGINYFTGEGPPTVHMDLPSKVGDYYRDDLTGTIYRLET